MARTSCIGCDNSFEDSNVCSHHESQRSRARQARDDLAADSRNARKERMKAEKAERKAERKRVRKEAKEARKRVKTNNRGAVATSSSNSIHVRRTRPSLTLLLTTVAESPIGHSTCRCFVLVFPKEVLTFCSSKTHSVTRALALILINPFLLVLLRLKLRHMALALMCALLAIPLAASAFLAALPISSPIKMPRSYPPCRTFRNIARHLLYSRLELLPPLSTQAIHTSPIRFTTEEDASVSGVFIPTESQASSLATLTVALTSTSPLCPKATVLRSQPSIVISQSPILSQATPPRSPLLGRAL